LSGDIEQDVSLHRIIPLRSLISGKGGIGIDQAVNAYYIGYWSLTHFLLHARQGHYADRYRRVIAMGGTLEAFEDIIGPIDQIEKEWYAYLLRQASILNNNDTADRR
jgi:alkyl sulfatase BDS1-like metallo-beta-lactamase superfamily hydrolase